MNITKHAEVFLNTKLITGMKFNTLEYTVDDNLVMFKDITLNLMFHAYLTGLYGKR